MSTKRISIVQRKPFQEKMLGKITSWTTKFLSYACRVQLMNSVLYGIQMSRSQIFSLSKKIIQTVDVMCRRFLWTENTKTSRKALIAWDNPCWPKANGGNNFLDIYTWNKVAIGKLLWNSMPEKREVMGCLDT